jgi:hypothetical protein
MSKEVMKMALEALKGYRREMNDGQPCDAEKALEEALANQEQGEPDYKTLAIQLQQQRTWVGLTDEEFNELYDRYIPTACYALLIEMVEAKLKEKNT